MKKLSRGLKSVCSLALALMLTMSLDVYKRQTIIFAIIFLVSLIILMFVYPQGTIAQN